VLADMGASLMVVGNGLRALRGPHTRGDSRFTSTRRSNMKSRIQAAAVAAAFLAACGGEAPEQAVRDAELATPVAAPGIPVGGLFVGAPPPGAQLVYVAANAAALPADRPAGAFVPFSTFAEERNGIPNEFPAPDRMAALLAEAGVAGERLVVVAEPIPAGRAYAGFDYLGLGDRAVLLDGGFVALARLPAPVNGFLPPDSGPGLEVRPRDDMIVDADWVFQRLDVPDIVILDARPPAEFSGEVPGADVGRPGHIPGARNLFWQELVRSPEEPRLKDEAELRRLFEAAGVGPGDTVVAYCRTGGQASFLYTVASHLGYDVVLYDGSFVDWSRTDYPVAR
jgi:thiosulfate/3-mercaptopyruvate sulfurtransferase